MQHNKFLVNYNPPPFPKRVKRGDSCIKLSSLSPSVLCNIWSYVSNDLSGQYHQSRLISSFFQEFYQSNVLTSLTLDNEGDINCLEWMTEESSFSSSFNRLSLPLSSLTNIDLQSKITIPNLVLTSMGNDSLPLDVIVKSIVSNFTITSSLSLCQWNNNHKATPTQHRALTGPLTVLLSETSSEISDWIKYWKETDLVQPMTIDIKECHDIMASDDHNIHPEVSNHRQIICGPGDIITITSTDDEHDNIVLVLRHVVSCLVVVTSPCDITTTKLLLLASSFVDFPVMLTHQRLCNVTWISGIEIQPELCDQMKSYASRKQSLSVEELKCITSTEFNSETDVKILVELEDRMISSEIPLTLSTRSLKFFTAIPSRHRTYVIMADWIKRCSEKFEFQRHTASVAVFIFDSVLAYFVDKENEDHTDMFENWDLDKLWKVLAHTCLRLSAKFNETEKLLFVEEEILASDSELYHISDVWVMESFICRRVLQWRFNVPSEYAFLFNFVKLLSEEKDKSDVLATALEIVSHRMSRELGWKKYKPSTVALSALYVALDL